VPASASTACCVQEEFLLSLDTDGAVRARSDDGRAPHQAHAGLGVTDEHVDHVVEHLVAPRQGAGVPADATGRVGGALSGTRGGATASTAGPAGRRDAVTTPGSAAVTAPGNGVGDAPAGGRTPGRAG
jgi:hypothetical protein